ncbi:septal ring lytic transglycosylase RlpA family protein [Nitrosomonas communis]|uniref:septal ring lytic transglycosylase RlpA family protein n=1 Tax=Nitrosomonas communis TaxID=44574 RepID=UPI0026F1622E|nr:septal ring lytic transglycosylase RlpA family protein [Nitrosomonas communis]
MPSAVGYSEKGIASWYGAESGNRTAMGTRFYPQGLTAAHKTLPLPTKVRVTNLRNGRAVDVIVNDRGPFKKNRLIDLSHGAAKRIGLRGLTEVKVEYLKSMASNP